MAQLNIIWEDMALSLLDERDRYTRNAIREEFRDDPQRGAVEFDPAEHAYITPVSNNRFMVVWLFDPQAQRAVVRAVAPMTISISPSDINDPEALDRIKDYVRRAVKAASKGAIAF